MATHRKLGTGFSATANADLSANQYRLVYQVGNDTDIDVLQNNGTAPIGVLLNKPAAAGRAARVAGLGEIVKCEAGAAIQSGALVMATTGGRAITATGGTNVWTAGVALSGASGSAALFELQFAAGRGAQ